jgi:hypothetical protein
MSTSLLYHGWGIVGYEYQRTLYVEGMVIFRIAQDPTTLRCPCCESRRVIRRGASHRRFLALPLEDIQIQYLRLLELTPDSLVTPYPRRKRTRKRQ